MMGKTHLLIGGAAWLAALALVRQFPDNFVTGFSLFGGWGVAALGALAPDIDSKNSLASKMLGPVTGALSWIIRESFGGHRKITHSVLGTLIVIMLFSVAVARWHLVPWVGLAFVTGWVSHVLADMTTREGCPLLWPVGKHKFGLHLVTTGKKVEQIAIRPLALIANIVLALLASGLILWRLTRLLTGPPG